MGGPGPSGRAGDGLRDAAWAKTRCSVGRNPHKTEPGRRGARRRWPTTAFSSERRKTGATRRPDAPLLDVAAGLTREAQRSDALSERRSRWPVHFGGHSASHDAAAHWCVGAGSARAAGLVGGLGVLCCSEGAEGVGFNLERAHGGRDPGPSCERSSRCSRLRLAVDASHHARSPCYDRHVGSRGVVARSAALRGPAPVSRRRVGLSRRPQRGGEQRLAQREAHSRRQIRTIVDPRSGTREEKVEKKGGKRPPLWPSAAPFATGDADAVR